MSEYTEALKLLTKEVFEKQLALHPAKIPTMVQTMKTLFVSVRFDVYEAAKDYLELYLDTIGVKQPEDMTDEETKANERVLDDWVKIVLTKIIEDEE